MTTPMMEIHDELPIFDESVTIDEVTKSNQNHFLRNNSYYEIVLKVLANFKECPIVTLDTSGEIQYSVAHDTSFCSSATSETYMRLIVKKATSGSEKKLVRVMSRGDIILAFPAKNVIKVPLPSIEDIAKAADKEALAVLYDDINDETPKQLVYSGVVLPTELLYDLLENKTKSPFARLALVWEYFEREGVLRGPKGGKRTVPDQAVRIINLFGMYHIYHNTMEQEESDVAKKYKHIMKQFGVVSMQRVDMTEDESDSLETFMYQSRTKLKLIEEITQSEKHDDTSKESVEESKEGDTSAVDTTKTSPPQESKRIPKKQRPTAAPTSLICPPTTQGQTQSTQVPQHANSTTATAQQTSQQNQNTGNQNIPQQPNNLSQVAIDALVALSSTISQVNVNMGAINDSITASTQASGLSQKGVDGWGEQEIKGVKILSSEDPAVPIQDIRPRTRLLCGLKPTEAIKKIKRDNRTCDWAWNIAMITSLSRGDWTMNKRIDGTSKMEGITPPSTPMESSVSKGWYGESLDTYAGKEDHSTYAMTYKDLLSMAKTNFFCPEGYAQTEGCFENATMLSKEYLGEESHRTKELRRVTEYLRSIKGEFNFYWKIYKQAFTFSLVAHTHIRLAKFHYDCIYHPDIVSKQSLNLLEIFESIADQTFWNRYQHPAAMNAATIAFNLQTENRITQYGEKSGGEPSNPTGGTNTKKRNNENDDDERPTKTKTVTNTDDDMQSDMPFKSLHMQFAKMDLAGHTKPKVEGTEACLKWHFKGRCSSNCSRKCTHIKPVGGARRYLIKYRKGCEKLAEEARNGTSNNE